MEQQFIVHRSNIEVDLGAGHILIVRKPGVLEQREIFKRLKDTEKDKVPEPTTKEEITDFDYKILLKTVIGWRGFREEDTEVDGEVVLGKEVEWTREEWMSYLKTDITLVQWLYVFRKVTEAISPKGAEREQLKIELDKLDGELKNSPPTSTPSK